MGGGGGGGSKSIGDLSKLTEEAKQALSRERRNVFISFAYEDIDEVNLLRAQSKNELSDIAFNDWSVSEPYDSKNADYIRGQISDRIRAASATVVYLSNATSESPWVKWEVEQSLKHGKKVIAVHAGDKPPSNLPSFIKDQNIGVVPWKNLATSLK
jgi:antiphage defense system Thoeris ThsB-like protein